MDDLAISVRVTALAIAGVVCLATSMVAWPLSAESNSTPKYPRVIWKNDPAHRATIVWVTDQPGERHVVHYGPASQDGEPDAYRHDVEATRTVPELRENAYFHHAELTDLHPSTTYYMTVSSDGRTTEELHFKTAPADDRSFSLFYGGDSRSSSENRRRVNRRISALFESRDDVIGFVHGGDYVVSAMVWEQWQSWLEDWQLTRTDSGRLLPIVPGRGNHEWSTARLSKKTDNYNGLFGLPGGTDRDHWTTRLGSQVAVVTLDTNSSMGGDQRDWLEQQLDELTDSRRWIVANYHRPAYPAVKSPGAARTHWVPLFEEHDVDLVCESDGHVLKRTVPILDGERDPEGVVYVGEGGLGVPQRTPKSDRWYFQEPGVTMSQHHIQLLEFGPDALDYRAIGIGGDVLDQRQFEPAREGSPIPLDLESVRTPARNRIELHFSKGLVAESVTGEASFEIEPDVAIDAVRPHDVRDRVVVLETDALDEETTYRLSMSGVEDHLGHVLDETATASFQLALDREESVERADAANVTSAGTSSSQEAQRGCSVVEPPSPAERSLVLLIVGALAMSCSRRRRRG